MTLLLAKWLHIGLYRSNNKYNHKNLKMNPQENKAYMRAINDATDAINARIVESNDLADKNAREIVMAHLSALKDDIRQKSDSVLLARNLDDHNNGWHDSFRD